jgi:hypothetical protein
MTKKFLIALGATVSGLALAPAANAAILIGVAVNGGPITVVANDAGSGSASYVTTTGGYFYNVGATGAPILDMPTLLTQSVNVRRAGGAAALIDIYITQTDLTSPTTGLNSAFTSNTVAGLTATLTSYFSASNALFSGTELRQASFAGPGTFVGGNAIAVSGPWSETVRYSLNFTGGVGSNFNGTANLSAVPEPMTWAMFILGFGVLGSIMRRRSNKVGVAKASLTFA